MYIINSQKAQRLAVDGHADLAADDHEERGSNLPLLNDLPDEEFRTERFYQV